MQVLQQFAKARMRILVAHSHNVQLDAGSRLGQERLKMIREDRAAAKSEERKKELRKSS